MRISAVVPVFNVEQYLSQCVDSILRQTNGLCEVILVDDGSTDNSGFLCDEYAERFPGVVLVVHQENQGLGMARNTGLSKASGDYVIFIDSDDWLRDGAIEELACFFEESPDIVIGGFTKVSDAGDVLFEERLSGGLFSSAAEIREEVLPRLLGSAPNVHDSIPMSAAYSLYKLEVIRANGIMFASEKQLISEDLVFNFQFLMASKKAVVSTSVGYCYRFNQSSLTTSYRPDRFDKVVHLVKTLLKMIGDNRLSSECGTRLLKSFFVYLKMAINQERTACSGFDRRQSLKNIKSICCSEFTKYAIESYPVEELGFKQKIFIFLVEHELSGLLFALSNRGLLEG